MSIATPMRSFWSRAQHDPERLAIVDPDGSEWTYGEIGSAANRVTHALRNEVGLDVADPVAVVVSNTHAVYEIFAAVLQAGLYYVPINYRLTADEIEYILRDSGARVLISSEEFSNVCVAAARGAGMEPSRCVALGEIPGFRSYDELKAAGSPNPPASRTPGQRMYYTSGTTGRPKGVRKAFPSGDVDEQAIAFSKNLFEVAGFPTSDEGAHLVAGPTYHAAPLGFGMGALHLGQTAVLMAQFSAEDALRLIERRRVTTTHLVPTMMHRLLQLPEPVRRSFDLSSLRAVAHAAAPCPIKVKRRMIDWLGPIVHEYYSSSEGGGTRVSSEEWLRKPGTVGRPNPGAAIKILDEKGEELLPGEPGRVYMLLRDRFEYHNDPQKTAANRRGDFFTVGDIGYLDDDGYLFLCDRDSETIISGGVNIYPAEVEAVLTEHPGVGDVAVLGVPNDEWGEEVRAVVEPARGVEHGDELAQELIEFCRARLAHFKCPRGVDFLDTLPRLDNGKLYKRRIRERYWADRDRKI